MDTRPLHSAHPESRPAQRQAALGVSCPHCGSAAFGWASKLATGPIHPPRTCQHCDGLVAVPWSSMLVMLPWLGAMALATSQGASALQLLAYVALGLIPGHALAHLFAVPLVGRIEGDGVATRRRLRVALWAFAGLCTLAILAALLA